MTDLAISSPGCRIPPFIYLSISRQNLKKVIFRHRYFQETKNAKASTYNIRNVAGPRRSCGADYRRQHRNIRNQFTRCTNRDTRNHQHWNPRRDYREPCDNRQSRQHEYSRNEQHARADWKSICDFALPNRSDINDFAQSNRPGRCKSLPCGRVPQQHRYFNFFEHHHGNSTEHEQHVIGFDNPGFDNPIQRQLHFRFE